MDAYSVVAIFVGGVICFFGYPMIRSAIWGWGALVGGAFAVLVAVGIFKIPGGLTHITIEMWIVFAVGALIGALIARPLSVVIIFITGLALGLMVGNVGIPFVSRAPENVLLTGGLALISGLLAVKFQEILMIVTTAFVGGLMMVYGVYNLTRLDMILAVGLFFLLGLFGAAAQYKSEHPQTSWLG